VFCKLRPFRRFGLRLLFRRHLPRDHLVENPSPDGGIGRVIELLRKPLKTETTIRAISAVAGNALSLVRAEALHLLGRKP
jgi:hypothetical protein